MPYSRLDDYDTPHYGEPAHHDYGGIEAGYRGGGTVGGDWSGGRRYLEPYRGQSGTMWGPHDRDFFAGDVQTPRRSYRGLGPRSYRRSDDRIREDVCDLLTVDDDIDASDIEVQVNDNIVVLNGSVSHRGAKRRAEWLAEAVHGVRDVQNNLRIT
jgi:hypothetical protein